MNNQLEIDFINCKEDECLKPTNIITYERYHEEDVKKLFDRYNKVKKLYRRSSH